MFRRCVCDSSLGFLSLFSFIILFELANGLDNGLALSPPMGWRSWNEFGCNINQTMVIQQYEAMVDRTRTVNDKPMSLIDLGYTTAGIDDCWQKCGSGPSGKGFHNSSGYPNVNKDKFPDFKAMTSKARTLGVTPGWYGNNCHCSDHFCKEVKCFEGDVQATLDFGFESIKLDGCGSEKNISLYSQLFNTTGKPILIENCHNGNPSYPSRDSTGKLHCPMHFFRSSSDIRPTFGSILNNLNTIIKHNAHNLTGPGCWAYPDMLEVGISHPTPPGAKHHCEKLHVPCEMNFTEQRTHFGAWCIVSAPLVLGMDLRNATALDLVWPIISNTEAISINQQWVGDSGILLAQSQETVRLPNCGKGSPCNHTRWMIWTKSLPPAAPFINGTRVAILLMNNGPNAYNVSTNLSVIKGLGSCAGESPCAIRDVWMHKNLPASSFVGGLLAPHDSSLLIVSSPNPVSSCLQSGIQFDSKKTDNVNLEKTWRDENSAVMCQNTCAATTGCVCFTWNGATDHCWLMTSCKTPSNTSSFVSGPAKCP